MGNCCVVAEGWPSWSFALHALGVRNVTTVLPTVTQQVLKEVKETVMGSLLMEYGEWESSLDLQLESHDVVLVQGSDYFVSEMRRKIASNGDIAVLGIVPDNGDSKRRESLVERT